jgi:hypothetical protein
MLNIMFILSLSIFLMITNGHSYAETLEVFIKGVDDGVKSGKQNDFKEAVMNAKLQAIERAGSKIESMTKVENFTLKYDMIESKAKAILLPGFKVMDIGYHSDSTYQVVLVGNVMVNEKIKGKMWGKLRSKPVIFKKYKEARESWAGYYPGTIKNQFVNNEDGTVTDVKTGLMWMYSYENKEKISDVKENIATLNREKFKGFSDWRIPTLEELSSLVENKPNAKLENGRQSYINKIFDSKKYCWYLWSSDIGTERNFLVYVGEHNGGISSPGYHYQEDGICVACIKAVRSIE